MENIPVVVITAYANSAKRLPIKPDLFLLKPVDIHDLGNLLQSLREKTDQLREPPYDTVTHLYTESYFSVRLIFPLERVKRLELEHFGVLFAELHPFRNIQEKLAEDVLNALLRKMADHFRGLLPSSDILAWSNSGCFFSLFEEIPTDDLPSETAKSVSQGLNDFLELHDVGEGLRMQTGVVLCDDGYKGVQEILNDVDFARNFVKSQPEAGNRVYTREEIHQMRRDTVS
jgi:GGDEF domain-containing protein